MLNSLSEKLVSYVSPSSDGRRVDTDNVVGKIQSDVDSDNGGKHKRCDQTIDVDSYSPCVKKRRIEEGFVQKVTNSMAKMAEWLVHSTNYLLGRLDDDPHFNLATIQEQEEVVDEEQENGQHADERSQEEEELGATEGSFRFMNLPNTKRTLRLKMQHPDNNEYLHRPPIHDRRRLFDYQESRQFNGNASAVRFLYSSQSQKVSLLSQTPQVPNGGAARYLITTPQVRVNNCVRNVSLSSNNLYSVPCHTKVRRSDVGNVVLQKPHMRTAAQCVRLEEKEQYRRLIQQFSRGDFNNEEKKDFHSIPCQTSRSSSVTSQDSKSEEGLKINLPPMMMMTVVSNESSLSEMPLPKHRIEFSDESQSETEKSSENTSPKSSPRPCVRLKKNPYLSEDWVTQLVRKYSASTREQKRKIEEEQLKIRIFQEKRKTQDEKLNEEIQHRLKLSEKEPAILKEEEIEEPPSLPEITPAMKTAIDSALKPQPLNEVLVEGFRIQIKRQDMTTLAGLNWLNDEVINFYLSLLMERSQNSKHAKVHSFNTFFYPKLQSSGYDGVRRWTRKVNIFAVKYLLIPVHLGMHWCLAVVNFADKTICYYDSMGGKNHQCLETIKKYLCDESLDKRKIPFHLVGWTTKIARDVPHQMNGSDCGMFACKYADYITREIPIAFTQADMPQFRRLMVYEILKKKLLT